MVSAAWLHSPSAPRSRRGATRRGSAYALVLSMALLVLVIGAGAIAAGRIEAKAAGQVGEIGAARMNALSGIEWGRAVIATDPNWRTTRPNGAWATDQVIGDGSFTLDAQNPNGAMNRSPQDPVVLTCTGRSGKARHKVQVTLASSSSAISCLDAAVCAGGTISLNGSTVSGVNQLIASNGAVSAVLGTINANVEASLTVTGVTFNGSTKSLVAARQLPGTTVFSYYVGAGTAINVNSLDASGGPGMKMQRVLLSPGTNPYGAANPNGIYVIDCGGQDVIIGGCRIVGTLVLLNAGSATAVQGSMSWAPAAPGLPCLLVQGNLAISTTSTLLTEVPTPRFNFNPAGTPYPYPSGTTDADRADTYPSIIDGMVYVSGNLTTSNTPVVDALMVGGTWSANGTLTLNYDPAIYTNPAPGFGGAGMAPVPGSWKQVVN